MPFKQLTGHISGRYRKLEEIPQFSDVYNGLLYDTSKSNLIAYSLLNTRVGSGELGCWWTYLCTDFIGVYKTAKGRYFLYRFETFGIGEEFNIKSLTKDQANHEYYNLKTKLIQWDIEIA